jgi:hypothetical protein
MTFEASMTFPSGGGITVQLIPASNRVLVVQTGSTPDEAATAEAMPRLLQHLANASKLPIRRDGRTYWPRPVQAGESEEWGIG